MQEIQKQIQLGRTALVADPMLSFGGADRELISILKLFPKADIYTMLFDAKKYPQIKQKVYTSFVQKLPFSKKLNRNLTFLKPFAYESFNLEAYDTVISISAGPAKGVITGVNQKHIAFVMTPPRNLWDNELNVRGSKLKHIYKPISKILNTYMRIWDYSISKRVDNWIVNSEYVQKKVKKIYGVDSTVIYPGVEEKLFEKPKCNFYVDDDFFLVVSRLYDYKKIDVAIRSCKKANKKLVIVGEGPDMKYLKKIAKDTQTTFLGFLPYDEHVKSLYKQANALIFCGVEDFGYVPVEAMAQGTPVIAYKEGGVLETVEEGLSGEFFNNEKELVEILKKFDNRGYNREKISQYAKNFSEEKFFDNIYKYFNQINEE